MTNDKPMARVEQLLPCPFCGGPAEHDSRHWSGSMHHIESSTGHAIYCADIGCIGNPSYSTIFDSQEEAVAAWNTRASLLRSDQGDGGVERRQCTVCTAIVASYPEGMCCHCHEMPWPVETHLRDQAPPQTVGDVSGVRAQPDTYEGGQYLFNSLRTFLGMAGIDASDCKLIIELPDRDKQRQLVGTLQRHTGERGSPRSAARIGNHSGFWQGVEYEFSVKGWNAAPHPAAPASEPQEARGGEGKRHNIKCWPDVFDEMKAGRKTAEFRLNDRDYRAGDTLLVREWDPATKAYTHRELTRTITHVLAEGFGMPAGYAMLSLAALRQSPPASSEVGETWDSINQWCDDTFGPATIPQIIERAKEEFDELETEGADHATEAADVVICLCRIHGFAEALQRKMAINRKRRWRLTGNGTGYHIPDPDAAERAREGRHG